MKRRDFIKSGAAATAAAGATITAAPAIAQSKTELTIVSTWPRDFPGLGISAQRLVERISELSEGCLLYTSPSPRDKRQSRMPSSA